LWLHRHLLNYNDQSHRAEPHSRLEDWQRHLPATGVQGMCSWERFCTFAREPERRKVAGDARVTVAGTAYEVDPDLAGETVVLWWGLFDSELYVEKDDQRYGPYHPVGGPIPLHRYRKFKKTRTEERSERIEALATRLILSRAALSGNIDLEFLAEHQQAPTPSVTAFRDPEPFQEFTYPTTLLAKLAIAKYLGQALAKLSPEQQQFIDVLLAETLNKKVVLEQVQQHFLLSQMHPFLIRENAVGTENVERAARSQDCSKCKIR